MEGREKGKKVVPFMADAAFFFERGVRFLNRHDLSRALRSFQRAVDCEPGNAVNHCNLAGVLSELGDFEKSNEILQGVIESIAPDMSECYFYMANNYANLGLYELAEEHVVKYLEEDPSGEFAPDADEMLDVLIHEFGGGEILRERRRLQQETTREKDLARTLLEEGKFHEASELLEQEIARQDDAIAARNNLALTRYYLGQMDCAIALSEEVLKRDPANVHALCNLVVFYRHCGQDEAYRTLLDFLKKLVPLQFDQGYKLATTLGILGEHQAAYRIFLQLIQYGDRHDPTLYFALAAASANLGRIKRARQWLLEVQALDPESDIAEYYLGEMDRVVDSRGKFFMSYTYQLPFHLRNSGAAGLLQQKGATQVVHWAKDPSVRSSLYFALYRGPYSTKREALQAFAVLGDRETTHILKEFVKDTGQSQDIIWNGLFVLQRIGIHETIPAYLQGELQDVSLPMQDERLLLWNKLLLSILKDVHQQMAVRDQELTHVATELWLRYVQAVYTDLPRIVKRSVWSAALDYVTRRYSGRTEPQAVVAARYEVSVKALAKAAHAIMITL